MNNIDNAKRIANKLGLSIELFEDDSWNGRSYRISLIEHEWECEDDIVSRFPSLFKYNIQYHNFDCDENCGEDCDGGGCYYNYYEERYYIRNGNKFDCFDFYTTNDNDCYYVKDNIKVYSAKDIIRIFSKIETLMILED